MKDEEIHVGDILRVREWNDMTNEFKVDLLGDIKIPKQSGIEWFYSEMKKMCGDTFTVKTIGCRRDGNKYYRSVENIEKREIDGKDYGFFVVTVEMLEPLVDDEWDFATDEDIKALFC